MRIGILTLLGVLAAGAGVSLAQSHPGNLAFPPSAPAESPAPEPPTAPPNAPLTDADFTAIPAALPDADPPGGRFWFAADYLLWWTKKGPLPTPLVTTGPPTADILGGLTQPDTRVLFGGSEQDYGTTNGLRLGGGLWLDGEGTWGIEGNYFLLERRATHFAASSDANGSPVLAQPFLAADGSEFTEIVSLPGFFAGGIDVLTNSRLQGWEVNGVANAFRAGGLKFDLLAGYRTLDLDEGLQVSAALSPLLDQFLTFQGQPINTGSTLGTFDSFQAQNHFFGGQLGGRLEWALGRLGIAAVGKVALGDNQELVRVGGTSTLNVPGGSAVTVPGTVLSFPAQATTAVPGGVLAQSTNSGEHFRDQFAVVPEVGVQVSFHITPYLEAHVGYTFLYWSSVVRPGNVVDRTVEAALVPTDPLFGTATGTRPAFQFHSTDYWAQGVNFGLGLQF
jgi:hypothetical protein